MALFFRVGNNEEEYNTCTPNEYKHAIKCAQSFNWEEISSTWPKKFKCKTSGFIAIKLKPDDPFMVVNNKLLLMDMDEVIMKDIIE